MQGIEKDNRDNGAIGMLLVLALNLSSIHSFQNALIYLFGESPQV
jgi:hypothetical protein